jgi:IS5 family transposase
LTDSMAYEAWQSQWFHYRPLILKVIDQTERRVFGQEKVPASDKIISVFEEHSDIIVKGYPGCSVWAQD